MKIISICATFTAFFSFALITSSSGDLSTNELLQSLDQHVVKSILEKYTSQPHPSTASRQNSSVQIQPHNNQHHDSTLKTPASDFYSSKSCNTATFLALQYADNNTQKLYQTQAPVKPFTKPKNQIPIEHCQNNIVQTQSDNNQHFNSTLKAQSKVFKPSISTQTATFLKLQENKSFTKNEDSQKQNEDPTTFGVAYRAFLKKERQEFLDYRASIIMPVWMTKNECSIYCNAGNIFVPCGKSDKIIECDTHFKALDTIEQEWNKALACNKKCEDFNSNHEPYCRQCKEQGVLAYVQKLFISGLLRSASDRSNIDKETYISSVVDLPEIYYKTNGFEKHEKFKSHLAFS